MSRRSQLLFLLLVLAQVAHSVEEYVARLFDVFAPARFVSGLISTNLALGFVVFNVAFIAIGAACYVGPVRAGGRAGWFVAAAWVVIELANGIGHITIAALSGGYFAGAWTAALLVPTAALLACNLMMDRKNRERIGPSAVE